MLGFYPVASIVRMYVSRALVTVLLFSGAAHARCIELSSGRVELEVAGCREVDPNSLFTSPEQRATFDGMSPPGDGKKLLESYQGILLSGKVTSSSAIAVGAKTRKKALLGEALQTFVAGATKAQCSRFMGKRIRGTIAQTCCDGPWEVPCLLETSYTFTPSKK